MADKKEKPLTREDALRLIEENGGTAGCLDLSGKTFEEGADLSGLDLAGVILTKASLKEANLRGAPLVLADLQDADLSLAHLEGASLSGAHLERARLVGAHFENAYLSGTHLEGANLTAAHFEDAILGKVHFEGAALAVVNFERTPLQYADWGDFVLGEENAGLFDWATEVYRKLKIWHANAGMYDIAGEFFFREMTVRRKALKWQPNPFPRAWSKFISLICGYGERPLRVVASALVVVLGLALIYLAIGTLTPNTLLNSLYYSAVSFTALGYGQWAPEPTGWVKGLGAFEAFIGVFMMALFLITFIRKMTR